MDSLEDRLQKRTHASLYALIFLTVLLGLSVLLEGCDGKFGVGRKYGYDKPNYAAHMQSQSSKNNYSCDGF